MSSSDVLYICFRCVQVAGWLAELICLLVNQDVVRDGLLSFGDLFGDDVYSPFIMLCAVMVTVSKD